jgi:long-chain acyl-CoA synthetase
VEKFWLKSYPKGIPSEINPDQYSSIVTMIEQSFAEFSSHPAFYNYGVTITFKQLDEYSKLFAAYLQQVLKLKKGDRIALMLPNILQYPVALYGALRAGLIVVNVNPLYTPPELIHQLNDAQVETLIVLSNFASTVEKALPELHLKNIILTDIGDLFPRWKAIAMQFVLKYIQRALPSVQIPNTIAFRNALKQAKNYSFQKTPIVSSDIAFLQYTGGTTGVAKGAMLTHRNIVANVLQAEAWFNPDFEVGKEIIVTALPLYHIFSLLANCLFIPKIGGLNILITNPRDLPHFVKELSRFKFTVITGVNTLFHALLSRNDFSKLDFSRLKVSLGGGMAVQRAVAERWQKVTKKPILEAYGLTETSPCVSINPCNLKSYNGTVGLPVSSTDIKILDDAYQELPPNKPGELAIKGPQVMLGYWNNLSETEKVLSKEGWLLTGDIALLNDEGYLRIVERKKDMILVSGFNVYPNEIEDTLMRMTGISEVAIIGVPDENSGEMVKAFIVKKNPDLTKEEVLKFSRENLTGYKIPKFIEFCNELPKTNVGKISRRELRSRSEASHV